MSARSLQAGRGVAGSLGLAFALLAAGIAIPLADRAGHLSLFIAVTCALAALVVLLTMPLAGLPVLALLLTLLVPSETPLLPHHLQGSALGVIPLAVWMIRAPRSTRGWTPLRCMAFLLGAWLILSQAFAPFHTHRGWEWLLTFTVSMLAIVSAPRGPRPRELRTVFLLVASTLGAYALLEGIVLHQNVLFGGLFDHLPWWHAERDNVSYRVTTLLGHPLFNGLVFSTAAVLATSELLSSPRRPLLVLTQLVVLIGATDMTRSRGAAVALITGVVVVLVFTRGRSQRVRGQRLLLGLGMLMAAAVLLLGLQARNSSAQGKKSAQVRVATITRAEEALRAVEPFGAGPGESDAYRKAHQLPGFTTDLENSYAELAVSLGLVGLGLVVVPLLMIVVLGLQNELVVGEAAALLTILIDVAGFNAIEGHKPTIVLIALFAVAILTSPVAVAARAPEGLGRRARRRGDYSLAGTG